MKLKSTLLLDAIDLRLLAQLQSDASQSNQDLARSVHISPPTCLRRVKRLHDIGLIERQVLILNPERLASAVGHSLTILVEITLDVQGAERLALFEKRAVEDEAVQQCYQVSSGPDFVLVVCTVDMPQYLAVTQRLFTADANVRNVKSYFSVKRAKFETRLPLF